MAIPKSGNSYQEKFQEQLLKRQPIVSDIFCLEERDLEYRGEAFSSFRNFVDNKECLKMSKLGWGARGDFHIWTYKL